MCAHTNICFTFLRSGLFERISVICSVCPRVHMPPTITPYTQIFHEVIGSRLFHIYLRHKCIFVSGWGQSERPSTWWRSQCFVEGHFSNSGASDKTDFKFGVRELLWQAATFAWVSIEFLYVIIFRLQLFRLLLLLSRPWNGLQYFHTLWVFIEKNPAAFGRWNI